MSLVIAGRGVPLRRIMREKLYEGLNAHERAELVRQLADAALNSGRPSRREQYAAWAKEMEGATTNA